MSASLRKFNQRAPRYTLRPTDQSFLRFSSQDEPGTAHVMKVVDISMSGMAFVVDREHSPFIYDIIKVEIPLGNGEQIAWWAKVTRMEEYAPHKWYMKSENFPDDSKVMVGVHFSELPPAHAKAIQATLSQKFADLEREKSARYLKTLAFLFARSTWMAMFYVGLTAATVYIIYNLSRPSENYSSDKGAPWGKRMWYIDGPNEKGQPEWDNSDSVKE